MKVEFDAMREFFEGMVEQAGGEFVDGADVRGVIQVFGYGEFLQLVWRRHVWSVGFEQQAIDGNLAEYFPLFRFPGMGEVTGK